MFPRPLEVGDDMDTFKSEHSFVPYSRHFDKIELSALTITYAKVSFFVQS